MKFRKLKKSDKFVHDSDLDCVWVKIDRDTAKSIPRQECELVWMANFDPNDEVERVE